jgi:acyl-CoA ligase (AMP-forming) (exosortase A-associated)
VDRRIEDTLFERAREIPEKTAVLDHDRSLTYSSLAEGALALARRLEGAGVGPGDRVAIYLEKSLESVTAMYGAWTSGGIVVPVNEGLHSRQVEHILRHSGSAVLVTESAVIARLQPKSVGSTRVLCLDVAADEPLGSVGTVRALCAGNEPAAILYTSGSTGLPKGILISHNNLLAGARIVSQYLAIRPDERILSVLPFSFDYGLNQLLTAVHTGALLALQRSHLPADICRALERYEITAMAAVPPLWNQLMQGYSPLPKMQPAPKLRYITNSGGVFPPGLVARYRALLPDTRIYLMYGLSEAFRSTYLPPEEIDRRPGSMGMPIPETEIHLFDERGYECAPGDVGELVHRGPTVALGYWNDPEATAAVFRPSPFGPPGSNEKVVYSGDLVRKDADGYLYFVGRRDQLIKSLGYRVSPDEVEATLTASGLISEVIVWGAPDEVAGQAIVAHVVPRSPETFSESDLLAYCRREMPRYMVPRNILVHSALPRTASGKLDRKSLAQ